MNRGLDLLVRFTCRLPPRPAALVPAPATGDQCGDPLLDEDYLVLSTVHSAKGQEWSNVYILNVSDGSFPSEFSTGRPELIEEERRLCYVGITRAMEKLVMTYAECRRLQLLLRLRRRRPTRHPVQKRPHTPGPH